MISISSKVEKIAIFLASRFPKGIQMFGCHGTDPTETIYDEDGVEICWQWYYEYIDVIGLSDAEYAELRRQLSKMWWKG